MLGFFHIENYADLIYRRDAYYLFGTFRRKHSLLLPVLKPACDVSSPQRNGIIIRAASRIGGPRRDRASARFHLASTGEQRFHSLTL